MRAWGPRVVLPVAILAALLIAAVLWWWFTERAPGSLAEDRLVVLESGAGVAAIAERLEAEGVIGSAFAFKVSAALYRSTLQAGEYLFPAGASIDKVLAMLERGQVYIRQLTIPEGLTAAQVLALVDEAPALEGASPESVSEGALLPETYNYTLGETRADVVQRMRDAMDHALAELWAARAPELPFKSPEEALVLASIVEKETGVPEERARIAGVFLNRLELSMPLQSDPTVVYALTQGKEALGRPLTGADLELDSPYNTYRVKDLPPAPIASPGRAALEATLHPLETDELYFVATGAGGHAFAKTLDEHQANVARYRAQQANEAPAQSP